jgi:hypothetical protein
MADFFACLGDAGTQLVATLSDDAGPVDLTGATVKLHARHRVHSDAFEVDAVPDVDQSTNPGRVAATLTTDVLDPDVRKAGEWDAEWQVTKGGFVGTWPTRDGVTGRRDTLTISEQLG